LKCLLILVWQSSESVVVGILESRPFLRGGRCYRVSRPASYASQLKLLVRAPVSQGVQGSDWHNWECPSLDGLILKLFRDRAGPETHTMQSWSGNENSYH
jgi:hypothetical protein